MLPERDLCVGCGSCAAVCPQQCIQMLSDDEGFRRPEIDNFKCILCHRCEQACPLLLNPPEQTQMAAYAAKNRDDALRTESSSGGVFSALAELVLEKGGCVCAARYNADFDVVHDFAYSISEIAPFRGAKYTQSSTEHCFPKIRSMLQDGSSVLFVGTPCQTAGLSAFLRRDYPNLILVDMICHGVPSPKVWRRYLQNRRKSDARDGQIRSINLRSKITGWSRYGYSVDIEYRDGSRYRVPQGQDPFMRGFVQNLYLRQSCSHCLFKGCCRRSDLTLGDFWGIWDQHPDFDDNRGISLLLTHSDKGKNAWAEIRDDFDYIPVTLEDAFRQNPSALRASPAHGKREEFFARLDQTEDTGWLIEDCLSNHKKSSLLERVSGWLAARR